MRRGFTLIEILVAVGLLAMLAALMYGVIQSMFATSDDTDDMVETNHMARVSMERITRDLSQAYLSLNQGELERTRTVFIGERDRVVFCYVGNIPVHVNANETDQGVIEYKLGGASEDRDGSDLIRRFKPMIDDDPEDGGDELVIATGVKRLRFWYWNELDHDWEDDWRAEDPLIDEEPGFELPTRVRIQLVLFDKARQEWVFETQTTVYITRPLLFGKPTSQNAAGWQAAHGPGAGNPLNPNNPAAAVGGRNPMQGANPTMGTTQTNTPTPATGGAR